MTSSRIALNYKISLFLLILFSFYFFYHQSEKYLFITTLQYDDAIPQAGPPLYP